MKETQMRSCCPLVDSSSSVNRGHEQVQELYIIDDSKQPEEGSVGERCVSEVQFRNSFQYTSGIFCDFQIPILEIRPGE